MLTKHFDQTQVCILLFSNIERGNGGAGTYSVGITVMICPRLSRYYVDNLKCLYGKQGFCSFGISVMCKKVFQEKKLDYDILTP